jgi:tetratricopeptide (TPR) repeat protein
MYDKKAIKSYEQGRVFEQDGRLASAERAYKKALKINRDFIEAHNNLGNILLDRGRPKEAADSFRRAVKLDPDHPMLLTNLGSALQSLGEIEQAIECFQKVTRQDPNFAGAYNNTGNAFRILGRLNEAQAAYRQAIEIDPHNADGFNNLGGLLVDQGEIDEAVVNFRKSIEIDSRHREAHNGLGNALLARGELEPAIISYQKAIEINPSHKDAHNGLGNALNYLGQKAEAVLCYQKAIEINGEHEQAFNGLGNALSDLGESEQAIAAYRQAIEVNPVHGEAHAGLGYALSDMGEIDNAIGSLRKAIEINPQHAEAYRFLSNNKKFVEYDDDIRAMESLYVNKDFPVDQKMKLAFGLGKAYEDIGSYDKSMESVFEATRLKRASFEYSISDSETVFQNIKQTFSAEFFSDHPNSGCQDQTPIFILGMPRSGTSLVEQILASHPDVFGAGEIFELMVLTETISIADSPGHYPQVMADLDSRALKKLGTEYVSRIRNHSQNARYITNKTPENFLRIGFIKAILPNARIIHLTRDPMDNCLSIFKNLLAPAYNYSYDLAELGHYYKLYLALMEHWRGTLSGFVYDQSYEQLVADPETQISKLLDYCNLPWHDACLDFHKTRRKVKTSSNAQVRRPIYQNSVELWKRYQQQLEPLRVAIYD